MHAFLSVHFGRAPPEMLEAAEWAREKSEWEENSEKIENPISHLESQNCDFEVITETGDVNKKNGEKIKCWKA